MSSDVRRNADDTARRMLEGGVSRDQIGLLMSERSRARVFGLSRRGSNEILGPIAADAVFLPSLGVVAAGPLLQALSGLPAMLLGEALAVALKVDAEEAEHLAEDVRNGTVLMAALVSQTPPRFAVFELN